MKLRIAGLTICALLMLSTSAFAKDGMYIGLGIGSELQTSKSYDANVSGTTASTWAFKNGGTFDAYVGYQRNWWKAELEYSYAKHDATSGYYPQTNTTVLTSGKLERASLMANFLASKQMGAWEVYGGPGLGVSKVWWNINEYAAPAISYHSADIFTYQLIAGVNYTIVNNLDLGIRYKYMNGAKYQIVDRYGTPGKFSFPASSDFMLALTFHL